MAWKPAICAPAAAMTRMSGPRSAAVLAVAVAALGLHAESADSAGLCTRESNGDGDCLPQHQTTYQNARAVSSIVRGRIGPEPDPAQTPPLQFAPAVQADDPAANAIIDEAVSTATNDQAMLWNAWVDAAYIHTDRDHPVFSYDGPMVTTSLGVDRSVGESTVIGILVNYEYVDFDTSFMAMSGGLESNSFGVGVYGGTALTANIVADAMFIYSWGDNDVVDVFGSNSYDSEEIQAAANLTGYWFHEAWRYSPALGITWTSENQDAYALGLVPSRTLESGVALASMQIGRTHYYDDVRWIEPWLGVSAEWEFHTSAPNSGLPGGNLDPFDIRILGGINSKISPSVSMNFRADIAGLLRDDYIVGSVGGQLAVQF